MNKKIVFRFDIDTHKCIRDGVPNLLELSNKYNVPFTFFLNVGKSISVKDSISALINSLNDRKTREGCDDSKVEMMSAMQKLGGVKEYIYTALINPSIIRYKKEVTSLLCSNCEVGIHGGRNHAIWQNHALKWNEEKIENEIDYAISNIRKIQPNYQLQGFAAPAWVHPKNLDRILKKRGFKYSADFYALGADPIIKNDYCTIGVNLLGEPGGVAFFENCRVRGYTTDNIIDIVMEFIHNHHITVLYDHPYYAGIKEVACIAKIIERIQQEKVGDICTGGQLL